MIYANIHGQNVISNENKFYDKRMQVIISLYIFCCKIKIKNTKGGVHQYWKWILLMNEIIA